MASLFPDCLLNAIHSHHPSCRLCVWGLQGRKPLASPAEPTLVSLFGVLGSPCLHSVNLEYDVVLPSPHVEQLSEPPGLVPLLAIAPNIKHAKLQLRSLSDDWLNRLAAVDEFWEERVDVMIPSPSNLDSLSFSMGNPFNPHLVSIWRQQTDFSRIRFLCLDNVNDPAEVIDIASGLTNLEGLFIGFKIDHNVDEGIWENQSAELISVFESFRPLKFLTLSGLYDATLVYGILARHKQSLRGLMIEPKESSKPIRFDGHNSGYAYGYPRFDDGWIRRLAEICPYLEELRIQIMRTQGSWKECQIYKAIGAFPNLHSLVLDMDCSDSINETECSSSYDAELEDLQRVFINAAIDESLALAIWTVIVSSQSTRRLRNLRCAPFVSELYFSGDELLAIKLLSRSQFVSRGFSPDDPPTVSEIGKEEREAQEERESAFGDENPGFQSRVPMAVEELIQSIWPESMDWRDGVESRPLQSEEEEEEEEEDGDEGEDEDEE